MHESVLKYVGEKVMQRQLQEKSVLEVGSYNGYPKTVREMFKGSYTGVDMREGSNVDRVMNAHQLEVSWDESFDVVISTEMLEHDDMFWLSVAEMGRVLKQGGYLILTARGNGYPKHEHPSDYYRFMPASFEMLFSLAGCKPLEIIEDPEVSGVFGLGIKCS